MTATVRDIEEILPDEATVTISGIQCRVERIKTRGLAMFMRVIGASVGTRITSLNISSDPNEAAKELIGILMIAIPNAIDNTLAFVKMVVKPINEDDAKALDAALFDPEPEELLDVIMVIVEQEKGNFAALWGKARTLMPQEPET
jgi:hypothetical protein